MPSPFDDCRAKPDSDPRDVCPVCRNWLLLHGDGIKACADPLCKAAHGVRTIWLLDRAVIEVRDVAGDTWSEP